MDLDSEYNKLQINLQKLTPYENFFVGVVSGCIEVGCMQPILFCKNASQQGSKFSLNPRVLYRGATVSMVNMGVLTGLQFPLTNFVTSLISGGRERRLTNNEMILSGLIGGIISGFACAPMELILIQQQNFGGTLFNTPSRIMRQSGPLGLVRGTIATCGREGAWCCGYMGFGPAAHRTLRESYGMENTKALFFGSILSGIIVSTLSHPLDTIKTCMQGDVEQITYKSFWGTTKTLAKEGFQRFFFGDGDGELPELFLECFSLIFANRI